MRYGYGPQRSTDPEVLWDDPSWRSRDEATREALRQRTVMETDHGRSGDDQGLLGALAVAGAMVLGVAFGRRRR